ncbi:TIGR02569 family protein [Amycolatopsis carbonis]|uniref:TIGR02569 family protein n=1 Tax=Amycolatopsis carbonis TaxID=715471 RepID=A0A9Y2MY58_9PSEU|nr:TIGR02569 family protein [Amycolatopsis sp. 2-15]WIX83111.1 TIGR02569 family protein [Amycolatopsis sp. 2-15]
MSETVWRAGTVSGLGAARFRVATPIRTTDGGWFAEGWEAALFVAGEPDVGRADDVVRAGLAFHQAVAGLPRPAFLDRRDDPCATGDRAAWEELTVRSGSAAAAELLRPLVGARRPVDLVSQAVHGDLLGNVLFADGQAPAVIDWSVYWRPPSWVSAVVIVDALCRHGAQPDLATRWSHLPEWGQMLVRALICRIVTDDVVLGANEWTPARTGAYRLVVELVIGLA